MGKYLKRYSDFKIKSKLIVLISVFIISLIVMALSANFLFKSSETLTILANEERIFIENFNSGIEHFWKYENSGNPTDLQNIYDHFNNANNIAFTFAKIDSFMNVMPRNVWVPYFFSIFKEGAANDVKKVELMADQINQFVKNRPEKN